MLLAGALGAELEPGLGDVGGLLAVLLASLAQTEVTGVFKCIPVLTFV